jgi:hypothetical protein
VFVANGTFTLIELRELWTHSQCPPDTWQDDPEAVYVS